ncbi:MAG: endonuclease MutS2, partial [Clostridia bacterium]|nr:endonuclease MutS2 [Clostridia bacterium]
MNEKNLKVLEYFKILERLKEFAVSDMGRERAMELRPAHEEREVRLLQAQTEEAMSVIAYAGGNPMSSFTDVREYLRLSTIGATLSMKALLSVADALRACRAVRRALVTDREDTPNLHELGSRIATNRMLEEDILNAIISEEEMADRASPELYDIRRHVRTLNDKVRDRLNSYIRSSSMQKYLMDSIITM